MFLSRTPSLLIFVMARKNYGSSSLLTEEGTKVLERGSRGGFHSSFSPYVYLINRDRGSSWKRVEKSWNGRRGKHADVKWRENVREYDHWKEREWEKRGAQVAHTWCTVVREVRFLSTSLQFYRSGRVSLCLYIYIQGDPRNTRFPSPIGL